MSSAVSSAMEAMAALEAGAIANGDENRMVGHYWLRASNLAPTPEIRSAVQKTVADILSFAERVKQGTLRAANVPLKHVIHIGIGGSSLGAQFTCEALRTNGNPLTIHFLDNADPDSIDVLTQRLKGTLDQTLVSVVSKSGATPTPKYVERELESVFKRHGLDFSHHAVATTMQGTDLDKLAAADQWLARFPIWEWVGGRTSVTSAVGLLPAALQGVDIESLLDGAAAMDCATRTRDPIKNPAALLALTWYWLGNGRGEKNMVVLPYRDRLGLLARYVQQLVMESVGKKFDRSGIKVEQGFSVYGNKGSTDQHAYFQQLREGPNNFFVLFVGVQKDRVESGTETASDLTLGDYLFGSLEGTRNALYELGRDSITITLPDVTAKSLGALMALLERAVGIYAELINVNAYNQPGVDKYVADGIADLQRAVISHLKSISEPETVDEICYGIGRAEQVETVYKLLERLVSEPSRGLIFTSGQDLFDGCYSISRTCPDETGRFQI